MISDLNALIIFARVVEAGSFSSAARRLGMPLSTVSRRVAALENELGVSLLERSTHSLRLTDVGTEILEYARRTKEMSEAVESTVSDKRSVVRGTLRLAAPPSISDSLLAPIVSAFQASHPDVRVQIFVTERLIDHIVDGIDLSFHVGPLKDSSLVAKSILRFRHQLVASPDYLGRVRPPLQPGDLLQYRLLAFSHRRALIRWQFVHVNRRDKQTISFLPHLGINDFVGVTAGLLTGEGIGDLSPVVQPELMRDGRLVEVMPDWHFPLFNLWLVHVRNRHMARPVRVFKEFAADMAPKIFPTLPT
jgi:DNA-binding transcriptional LysR family regulator